MKERTFDRTIGIDYSGTRRPADRIPGLAVCWADADGHAEIVPPQTKGVKNWNRRELAEWLVKQLQEQDKPTLVGIDHVFSFPIDYFKEYELPEGAWDHFLADFREYWPTHEDHKRVIDILANQRTRKRCDTEGRKDHRLGGPKWTRLTDNRAPGTKPVFDFDIKQGQVATSTHAGLPWLLDIREKLRKSGAKVHFWPFDGWKFDEGDSVVAEVYPALWKGRFESRPRDMSDHQYDACIVATWLSYADRNGLLGHYFQPELSLEALDTAKTEGWILGVLDFIRFDPGAAAAGCGPSTTD